MSFVKKHPVRTLSGVTAAQDIDDNFDAAFAGLRTLQRQIAALSTPTTTVTTTATTASGGGGAGEDGADGDPGPPGPPGPVGATGASGPAGPVTLGPMGLDGIDGDDGMSIPGPPGPTGATGPSGPMGPPAYAFIYEDGVVGDDGMPGPPGPAGSSGSGSDWALVASQTISAGTAQYDFTGLAGYNSLLVIYYNVVRSGSTTGYLQVSSNNGSSFLSTSGDYVGIDALGQLTNLVGVPFYSNASTASRSGACLIYGFDVAQPKIVWTTYTPSLFIPSATAFNAVRITQSSGTMTSGNIYIYGK